MKYTIEELIKAVKIEAKNRADNAAYNGERHDGGSSTLLNQVKYYEMGMKGEYPEEWERFNRHIDPEYKDYLRLKNKFRE